jgi:hypothetical protein
MTGRISVIPEAGDRRWRSRSMLRVVVLGNLAFDFLLVYAVIGWLT